MSASHPGSNTFSPRALVLAWKRAYPAGSAVVMDDMTPDPHPIVNGTRGALENVDGAGQFHTTWEGGRSLAAIPGADKFRVKAALGSKKESYRAPFMAVIFPRGASPADYDSVGFILNEDAWQRSSEEKQTQLTLPREIQKSADSVSLYIFATSASGLTPRPVENG